MGQIYFYHGTQQNFINIETPITEIWILVKSEMLLSNQQHFQLQEGQSIKRKKQLSNLLKQFHKFQCLFLFHKPCYQIKENREPTFIKQTKQAEKDNINQIKCRVLRSLTNDQIYNDLIKQVIDYNLKNIWFFHKYNLSKPLKTLPKIPTVLRKFPVNFVSLQTLQFEIINFTQVMYTKVRATLINFIFSLNHLSSFKIYFKFEYFNYFNLELIVIVNYYWLLINQTHIQKLIQGFSLKKSLLQLKFQIKLLFCLSFQKQFVTNGFNQLKVQQRSNSDKNRLILQQFFCSVQVYYFNLFISCYYFNSSQIYQFPSESNQQD
ncbi:hypothetical protein ABPG74_020392 [Tetrahymena malaccensis]